MKYDGKSSFDCNRARAYLEKLIKQEDNFEIIKKTKQRTIRQNAYLHVCIDIYAIDFGLTREEAKTDLKRECPYYEFTRYQKDCSKTGKTKLYLTSTKDYTTDQAGKFIDWLRTFAGSHGCYIPTSDEYKENKWAIEIEIEKNKQYL